MFCPIVQMRKNRVMSSWSTLLKSKISFLTLMVLLQIILILIMILVSTHLLFCSHKISPLQSTKQTTILLKHVHLIKECVEQVENHHEPSTHVEVYVSMTVRSGFPVCKKRCSHSRKCKGIPRKFCKWGKTLEWGRLLHEL